MTTPSDAVPPDASPEPNNGAGPTKRTRARKAGDTASAPKARKVRPSRKKAKKRTPKARKPRTAPVAASDPVTSTEAQETAVSPHADLARTLMNFPFLDDSDLPVFAEVESARRGKGRPRKTPTSEQIATVERLAALNLTLEEMAYVVRVHPETFRQYREHFSAAINRGRTRLRMTSGAVLMREMLSGNMTALIWLEKTRLGMTEKVHTVVSNPEGGPVEHSVQHSGSVAIGLFLPPNGRDVPAAGQVLPGAIGLPSNNRDVPPS